MTFDTAQRPELLGLTSLRFFAAMGVVLFHMGYSYPVPVGGLVTAGYEMVTFFFVLSGFVLTYAYSDGARGFLRTTTQAFWTARFSRLAPAYYLALMIAAPPFIYGAVVMHQISLIKFAAALVLVPTFLQSLVPPLALIWNTPAWSLSVEAAFYASFPWLLGLCFRRPLFWTAVVTVGLIVIAAALRIAMGAPTSSETPWHMFVWYAPPLHFPQFIAGILLCRLFLSRPPNQSNATLMFWTGAVSVLLLLWIDPSGWGRSNVILVPLFAALIFGAAGRRRCRVLGTKPLVFLGHSSYAIYVLHIPLLFWWKWFRRYLGDPLPPGIDVACSIAFVVACSIATFIFIEQPLRRWLLIKFHTRSGRANRLPHSN